jgi:hypothetical protein
MIKKSNLLRFLSLSFAAAGLSLVAGNFSPAAAQTRDPFEKPGWAKPKNPAAPKTTVVNKDGKTTVVKAAPPAPGPIAPPAIQDRINHYKRLREMAAMNNQPIPKVTSVLTLDEMAVTGIFRTPRGYAAMVEAKPIKLSYTIYPGEKFFDGQLVAIEENRLVFRRVTKWTNGKFVAAEENKPLRQYTVEQEVQGTAPVETATTARTETTTAPAANTGEVKPQESGAAQQAQQPQQPTETKISAPAVIVSPLEEMARQPKEQPQPEKKDAAKKPAAADKKGKQKSSVSSGGSGKQPSAAASKKQPAKVAENKDQ